MVFKFVKIFITSDRIKSNLLVLEDDFGVVTFALLDVLVVGFGGLVTVEYILHLLVKSGSIFIITGCS